MLFQALELAGATLIVMERHSDERGFFARSFCAQEFAAHGLPHTFVQSSVSWNRRHGTVRGMHFQWPPSREGKLVRCLRGAIHDVMLDLRPGSPSYLKHQAVVLDQDSRNSVFIPAGMAHGFQTLMDDSEVLYQMSDVFAPELQAGFRWDDPAFAIRWPLNAEIVIAQRDATYPSFSVQEFEAELARRGGGMARWT